MQIQAQVFAPCALLNRSCLRHGSRFNALECSRKPVGLMLTKNWIFGGKISDFILPLISSFFAVFGAQRCMYTFEIVLSESLLVRSRGNLCQLRKDRLAVITAIEEGNLGVDTLRKRFFFFTQFDYSLFCIQVFMN